MAHTTTETMICPVDDLRIGDLVNMAGAGRYETVRAVHTGIGGQVAVVTTGTGDHVVGAGTTFRTLTRLERS